MARELAASDLRWRCPEGWLPGDTTAKVEPSHGIIGQERAVRALEFGLAVESLGFNVFVTGLTGTGRMTAIELHLRPLAAEGAPPDDLAFVFNFARPEQPRLLRVAAGRGVVLRDQLDKLLRDLAASLPGMFDGEEFQRRLELAVEDLKAKQQELIKGFERRVREAGFTLVQVQVGSVTRPEILPTIDDRPVTLDKLQSLAEEGKVDRERAATLEAGHGKLSEELQRVFHEVMVLRDEMVSRAEQLRRSSVEPTLKQALGAVAHEVKEPRVGPYLDEMLADMLDHLDLFAAKDGDDGDRFLRYRVNVVVDNGATAGRPVVIETEPSYGNLFGTVEAKVGPNLQSTSDHMRIRAGSLLRANGGFLVVNAFDAVSEAGVWPALKRALRYRRVVIRPRDILFAISGQALQPEPVEIDVKVVMIGDRALYDMLHELDEEFRKIFKVLCRLRQRDAERPRAGRRLPRADGQDRQGRRSGGPRPDRDGRPGRGGGAPGAQPQADLGPLLGRRRHRARGGILGAQAPPRRDHRRAHPRGGARATGPPLAARGEAHRDDARRRAGDRERGQRRRPDQRPRRVRPRLPRVRVAGAGHGPGRPWPRGRHQHRARGSPVGEHPRQGGADPHRLPARDVRFGGAALDERLDRVRAVVRRRRRRQRLIDRGVRDPLRALGRADPPGPRGHRFGGPERARSRRSAGSTRRSRASSRSATGAVFRGRRVS